MQHILDRAPGAPDTAALRAMFAARKQVFVDLLGWNLPILSGAYEVDQFDGDDAEYLVILDEEGRHLASARLLRTDRPHILGNLYPSLCPAGVPVGPTTREITRFCLDRRQTARQRRDARNRLVTALAEHAIRRGITDYTGVAELPWLTQILTFGWRAQQLGAGSFAGVRNLGSLLIQIDADTIAGLMQSGIYAPGAVHVFGLAEVTL